MRTLETLLRVVLIGAGLMAAAPAFALDGSKTEGSMAPPPMTPVEAFRSGAHWLKTGETVKAVNSLEYAAEKGHALAQWKLGRMYAEGDGVDQSDIRAFEYFSRIADAHADDNPTGPQARYVANAFVLLGTYYRDGIPDTEVKADYQRARQMYSYAASYYGDPDAQYHLARLLLDGSGPNGDPRQATRWLYSAANKGQTQAQAVLGRMLFKGEHLPRQAARGLMWLALAKENAAPSDGWIGELYAAAYKQASEDERAIAYDMLVKWMNGRRD
jgi:TPR repeat protein